MSEQQLAIPSAKTLNQIGRLQRKLAQRDQRIAGLMRRVAMLESALATKDMDMKRLPRDVTRAVQEALCNVRMIPVLGIRSNDKIIEVRDAASDSLRPNVEVEAPAQKREATTTL